MKYLFIFSLLVIGCSHINTNERKIAQESETNVFVGTFTLKKNMILPLIESKTSGKDAMAEVSNKTLIKSQVDFIKHLEDKGYDLSKVIIFPLRVDEFHPYTLYDNNNSNFVQHLDININFNFLYIGDDAPENLEQIILDRTRVTTYRLEEVEYGKADGTLDNLMSLSAFTKENADKKVGTLDIKKLNLSENQKLELRNQTLARLEKSKIDVNQAQLRTFIQVRTTTDKKIMIKVDSADKKDSEMLSELKLLNINSTVSGCITSISKFF